MSMTISRDRHVDVTCVFQNYRSTCVSSLCKFCLRLPVERKINLQSFYRHKYRTSG